MPIALSHKCHLLCCTYVQCKYFDLECQYSALWKNHCCIVLQLVLHCCPIIVALLIIPLLLKQSHCCSVIVSHDSIIIQKTTLCVVIVLAHNMSRGRVWKMCCQERVMVICCHRCSGIWKQWHSKLYCKWFYIIWIAFVKSIVNLGI